MTSASELFYQRRSRVGRPSTELPLALDPSGSDRGLHLNYGRRHHHNHHGNHSVHGHSNTNGRHDLDGCDPLRRSLHVRHNCHRVSVSHERSSARFDQGSSQHVPNNSSGPETSNSSGRPRVTANERLPGPVLLARARLLERLRGVSLSGSRAVDAGDWGINLLEPWSPVGSPYRDSRSERERIQSLKNKPPGLTLEELGRLKVEVYLNAAECGGEGEELIRLPCEHRFHSGCLDPWVRACGDCPYCRRDIVVSSSYQV
ncbi:Probable E3 ubiquitin-protein ligase RHY1A [Linum perenne]